MDKDGASSPAALTNLSGVLSLATLVAGASAAAAFLHGLWAALGIAVLIFVAAFTVGAFLGFLFGVPRVLSREGATAQPASAQATSGQSADATSPKDAPQFRAGPAPALQSNTNLERISDWLTTMIVGASLVELHRVNDYLVDFRFFLESGAKVFGDGAHATAGVLPVVGPIILLFGAAAGFLFMYLNTRLILIRLFAQIETFLSGGDEKLDASESAKLRQVAKTDGVGGFLRTHLNRSGRLSVSEALQLMRSALYKEGGYRDTIRIGGTLSETAAARTADYWFLLTAAFGQEYADAVEHQDDERMMSARDNALDAARSAIAIDASYRARLAELTRRDSFDNDLAVLFEREPELRRLLSQAN